MLTVAKFIVNAPRRRYTARLMAIRCDYHMHTPLCKHATGPMEAYVERGIEIGLREIGFSDHNPLPNGYGANVRMEEAELDYYVKRVLELQYQYRGKIDVLLGLEMDYVDGLEDYCRHQLDRYPWDYVIGSIHYLDTSCTKTSWPRNFTGDISELYARYFEQVRKLARSGMCDIIAHFDLPKRTGKTPTEREADEITRTLQEVADHDVCIEINTSGYRHPELTQPEPYPSLPVVEQALALGIPLTVNSDSHKPEQVGTQFVEIDAWLKGKGCQKLASFYRRQRDFYSLT